MTAEGIVEAVDGTADCDRGFDPALEDAAPPDAFGLEGLEERLDQALSKPFPLPDIEIEMPFFLSSAWDSMEQYWLPRSAWRMSPADGRRTATARRRANTASSLSSRSAAAPPTTRRAKRSMTTAS